MPEQLKLRLATAPLTALSIPARKMIAAERYDRTGNENSTESQPMSHPLASADKLYERIRWSPFAERDLGSCGLVYYISPCSFIRLKIPWSRWLRSLSFTVPCTTTVYALRGVRNDDLLSPHHLVSIHWRLPVYQGPSIPAVAGNALSRVRALCLKRGSR